ncbi:hypothetical protein [uncultured Selenomonas sp.]|uniref:hypothetical protein n=1 Tax=uncultured Selenomonas sp. TaxID=159275 RepID=UPI0028E3B2D9|nr:hypothetical protein [uncultured Selenomonas sp.]
MDWEQLGFMVGQPLGGAWAANYVERGKDKARDKLAGMYDPTEADRRNAMRQMDARYGGGLIGKNPETLLLQQKRDWMQADNDARYLLNNGYAEDSPDVQKFRQKQAAAHANAEELRGFGRSTGIDLSQTGAGLGLADLKDAVNRSIAPMMYQKYPDMQEQIAARNAWAGQTAREIMGAQGVQPLAPTMGVPVQGGAAAPPAVGGAAPMTPPAAQLGGYTPQGTNLLNFDPNAGFGIAGAANPVEGTANPSKPGVGLGSPNGRTITSGDVYKYLQDAGYIPKEKTYAEEVEEIAKEYARARAEKMDDREVRKYLKEQGVPSYIARQVMAEQKQQRQEQMKKNALAQAAAASSSPQMAAFIAAAAADPNTKLSDITGLINATNPDLRLDTIDLGGTKVAMTHDTKGRVKGGAQVLPMTISPKDIASLRLGYDTLGYRAQNDAANRNAANYRAQLSSNTALQTAAMRAAMSGKGKGTGQGEERTAAEKKIDSMYGNQFNDAYELWNKEGEVSREDMGAVADAFNESVEKGIADGTISSDDATYFRDKSNLVQLMYAARFGEKEEARKIWSNFSDDYLSDPDNPDYTTLNDIYQWLSGQDEGEKAHVQNTLPEASGAYRPVGYEDSGAWMYH